MHLKICMPQMLPTKVSYLVNAQSNMPFETACEILILITFEKNPPLKAHAGISGLNIGLSLHLHPYFIYVSNEGSGELFVQTHLSLHC